ncbi:uncharacterized protein SCHCODRAFT_02499818 [Schizophyllum commune H4-8]|uniref:uncharacterized protein n=1 Tax=Schizophyllum commune (strain H4-8 / FGSC 9210) TaxID=578458 RepID=UPI00215E1028|nr:uncharacterized protein SCHCODRAFT_02499818 [Schizophyllum commune H4-8]KAI5893560.1 hypothetical protein SCHCODRAFT_02499818 [Schizophyllum commune H4-8]
MHIAFRSEEIRSMVFEELPRATLGSLAATCQDFHESALRILWRECWSLDHFVKLLPKTTCIYIVDKYRALRRPKAQDLTRIRHYARFVRSLTIDLSEYPLITAPEVFREVCTVLKNSGDFLFPNLRKLTYLGGQPDFTALVSDLIPPTLVKLTVSIERDASSMLFASILAPGSSFRGCKSEAGLLLALNNKRACPLLTALDMQQGPTTYDAHFGQLLSGWDSLENVSISGRVDADAVQAVLALPRLRSLEISGRGDPSCALSITKELHASAPSLEKMKLLDLDDVRFASTLLRSLQSVELIDLHICGRAITPVSLVEFCEAVAHCCSHASLRNLVIGPVKGMPSTVFSDPFDLTFSMINPLLALANLVELEINLSSSAFTNDDLHDIAVAFPRLQRLSIHGWNESIGRRIPASTLAGWAWLARHCRDLRELHISVNGCDTCMPVGIPTDCAQHSLRQITVSASPILSHVAVASFLARFFPKVDTVIGVNCSDQGWGQVASVLPLFVEARTSGYHGDFRGVQGSSRPATASLDWNFLLQSMPNMNVLFHDYMNDMPS